MRPLFLLPALCLTLAACGPQTVTTSGPAPMPVPEPASSLSTCGGDSLLAYVGQPLSILPASGGWHSLRVIEPGMMMTMDHSPTRMNVQVDSLSTIRALSCG